MEKELAVLAKEGLTTDSEDDKVYSGFENFFPPKYRMKRVLLWGKLRKS